VRPSDLAATVRERGPAAAALDHSLVVLPVLLTGWLMWSYASRHAIGVDFSHSFWWAGLRVRDGLSPYVLSDQQILAGMACSYPALSVLGFAPFSLVSPVVGSAVFVGASLFACLAALRLLGIRDWRLYAVSVLSWPVISGWQTANLSLIQMAGIAAAWRWRDRPLRVALVVGLLVSIKPVVWPLGLWLLATRRYRAGLLSVAVALALNLVSWAALGFGRLGDWLHLVSVQSGLLHDWGYGLPALASHLGIGQGPAGYVQIIASVALALVCLRVGRAVGGEGDRRALTLAVALMLLASPIVDNHYLAWLLVPLAIARPRLHPVWLVSLVLFWFCPTQGAFGGEIALAWISAIGLTVWMLRTRRASEPGMASPESRTRSQLRLASP
jgi:hypothetical protein